LSKISGSPPAPSHRAQGSLITRIVRLRRSPVGRSRSRQARFPFIERAATLERVFKIAVSVGTVLTILGLAMALPVGRYWTIWLLTRTRWAAQSAVGLKTDHREIEADWRRRRLFDVASARKSLAATFIEYPPAMQRLLHFAELDPDHALVRWGNFDRTVLLPGNIFEADNTGRSYRFRPSVRSIWVRNFPIKGQVKAYFQVLDKPEVADLVKGTGATVVEGSTQTTNSWGLRGPEPNLKASWRGIVLGDSYMQGLFVGDQETPTECLKRELNSRLQAPVEILNTGHLGYSPEQYYYTLLEYGPRLPPQFVVISIFANDFGGDTEAVLHGKGDWEEARYWLGRIREYCLERNAVFLVVPAPWVKQLEEPQLAGNYPGQFSNVLEATGLEYLDPIEDFVNAHLEASLAVRKAGKYPTGNSLFNGRVGDAHFSAEGCRVWAKAVGRRLELVIEKRISSINVLAQATAEEKKHHPRDKPENSLAPRRPRADQQ
jgi:hypothetical protein